MDDLDLNDLELMYDQFDDNSLREYYKNDTEFQRKCDEQDKIFHYMWSEFYFTRWACEHPDYPY